MSGNVEARYADLAHKAGCLRKRHKLTPMEAAACVLWLHGAAEKDIQRLSQQMQEIKKERWKKQCCQ